METIFPRGRTGGVAVAFAVEREIHEMDAPRRRQKSRGVRTADELIELGDQHFDKFSDREMNMLFQYLREKDSVSGEKGESLWRLFQYRLSCNGVPITIFQYGEYEGHDISFDDLFHRLWTQSAKMDNYSKMAWKVFRKQLFMRGIST